MVVHTLPAPLHTITSACTAKHHAHISHAQDFFRPYNRRLVEFFNGDERWSWGY
jgi:hypothetical protein